MTTHDVPAHASGTFLLGGDLPVYRMGFGAMRITGRGIWDAPADPEVSKQVLRDVVDLGINFIDTADSYGPHVSENLIREALYPYPAGLVVATKGGLIRLGPDHWEVLGRPDYLISAAKMSARRLGVDTIDLYQLHRIDASVPAREQFEALKQLQDEGVVRHVGLSQVSVAEIEAARKVLPIVSVQNLYSVVDRTSEDIVEYCEQHSIGFIPWFPLGGTDAPVSAQPVVQQVAADLGATTSQVALAWLLRRSPVMLPIPGTNSPTHLRENTAAATLTLSDDAFAALSGIAAPGSRI
jgi:aryl-alcohol dehydrogenase-like predicted oxidoreductase